MATLPANNASNEQPTEQKKAIVCLCCLGFFPVLYLIGSTIMNFFG